MWVLTFAKRIRMVPTFDQLPSVIQELKNLITSISTDVIDIKSKVAPANNTILDVDEASAFLKCKTSTLHRLARDGEVNSFKRLKQRYFLKRT
jgi:hypothetical protein